MSAGGDSRFTRLHRGGSGPPLLCLHGFLDSWRTWELVLPALERRHDVLALTLPGHAGGPPARDDEATAARIADALERALDDAGWETAHVLGNSLGGYLALVLAERGRARSVVALAPAGGWSPEDDAPRRLLAQQRALHVAARLAAPNAEALLATPEGRRRATQDVVVRFEHLPVELLAHQLRAVAGCAAARPMIEHALRDGWPLDAERVTCPVRIVWGTADRLLPWPSAAARWQRELPQADWVVLDDVGHAPQLDVPLVAAELVLGWTAP